MSKDMIEESVARALYELEPLTDMGNIIPWEALTMFGRDRFERRARAAISAHLTALSASGYVVVKREEVATVDEDTSDSEMGRRMARDFSDERERQAT